jgi:transcriptional regulator with XRE-family HTH domain
MKRNYTKNTKLPTGQRFNIESVRTRIDFDGFSYREIAVLAGVNHSTIARTIGKGIAPRPDILAKVCGVLGIDIESLIETAPPHRRSIESATELGRNADTVAKCSAQNPTRVATSTNRQS